MHIKCTVWGRAVLKKYVNATISLYISVEAISSIQRQIQGTFNR